MKRNDMVVTEFYDNYIFGPLLPSEILYTLFILLDRPSRVTFLSSSKRLESEITLYTSRYVNRERISLVGTFLSSKGTFMNDCAKKDYLNMIKWGKENKCPVCPDTIMIAVEKGYLETFVWLTLDDVNFFHDSSSKIDPLSLIIDCAIGYGRTEMLKWINANIFSRFKRNIVLRRDAARYAASCGYIDLLKWLHQIGFDF